MIYLAKSHIIQINRATIEAHGGNFIPPNNFLHAEKLDFLIEAVQSELFGQSMYPTVAHKAALYCYNLICNHIFTDGNKRTGLASSLIFLNLNGYDLAPEISNEVLTSFILMIASGNADLDYCISWFEKYIVLKA